MSKADGRPGPNIDGSSRDAEPDHEELVRVAGLSYTFAGRSSPTLREISFSIAPGTWTLLTGGTGSGKTTLLRALAGLIPRHAAGRMSGLVEVCGVDTRDAPAAVLARHVGLVLQSPDDQIVATTVRAEVAFGLENLGLARGEIDERARHALDQAGLADRIDAPTRQLSGGQKQRLVLASILAMNPRVLLLDEPLSQLDPRGADELLNHVRALCERGIGVVMAEHRLDEVLPHADRVLALREGWLARDVVIGAATNWQAEFQHGDLALPEVTRLSLAWKLGAARDATTLLRNLGPRPDRGKGEAAVRGESPARVDLEPRADRESTDVAARQELLRIETGKFRYSRRGPVVLDDIRFSLHEGQSVAVVGRNGSGKSTLLACMAGILGTDRPCLKWSPRAASDRRVAYLPQNPDLTLFCRTVDDELRFAARQRGLLAARIGELTAAVSRSMVLDGLRAEPPQGLSQGQRLRAALGAVLTMEPNLLLLDEPTTGQERALGVRILHGLREWRSPVGPVRWLVFATHDIGAVVRQADRVLILRAGRLEADCTPEQLLDRDDLLEIAGLKRSHLWQVRHELQLRGWTVDELAREYQA